MWKKKRYAKISKKIVTKKKNMQEVYSPVTWIVWTRNKVGLYLKTLILEVNIEYSCFNFSSTKFKLNKQAYVFSIKKIAKGL